MRPAPLAAASRRSAAHSAHLLGVVLDGIPREADLVALRDGARWLVAACPDDAVAVSGPPAFVALDRLASGWWAGFVAYDLARAVERFTTRLPDDLALPDLVLGRFDTRVVIEGGDVRVEGDGPARRLLDTAARDVRDGRHPGDRRRPAGAGDVRRWSSSMPRDVFEDGVRAAQSLIEAGECYQVNLTRRLSCDRPLDPVALFTALTRSNPAPHAALIRLGGVAVVSASPERFLRRRGDRVETRPIKGTAADPVTLAGSAKDRAENVMIVDLARNDLGRVCEYGSVEVPGLCEIEAHPGLYHLVSTVRGTLRTGTGPGDLLRATFPPASVTGAPKPRVLQAIEDLEPSRRGVYCGSLGWLDTAGESLDLNVAIRTFVVAGGQTHLGVGAGIVADSDPGAEWRETELKAARLLAAAGTAPSPLPERG